MSIIYDFAIISDTPVAGIALVQAQNEDAWNYLHDELGFETLSDGSAPVWKDTVGDFILTLVALSSPAHAELDAQLSFV